jgi:hypothetical protein
VAEVARHLGQLNIPAELGRPKMWKLLERLDPHSTTSD